MKINKLKIFFLFLFIVLLISSFYYLKYTWNHTLSLKTDRLTQLVLVSGASLNGEMLKLLTASPEDIGTVPYESIKRRLMQLPIIDPSLKFAYIYTQIDGKIYFIADSEPVDSEGYSPPGQEYTEAAWSTYQPFKDGLVLITPPTTDRWGTWISILVPMIDFNTGLVTAVFGMDYPAENWTSEAILQTSKSGIAFFFVFIILLLFNLIETNFYKVKNSKNKYYKLKKELEKVLDSIPAWVFYKDTKNSFITVNKAFTSIVGKTKEQIEGKSAFDLFPKEQAEAYYQDDLEVIKSGQSKLNIIEKMDSPAGTLWVKTDKILFKDEAGDIVGIIGFSLDITKQINIEDAQKKHNQELEKINKLMVGREMEMIKLKKEIIALKEKNG